MRSGDLVYVAADLKKATEGGIRGEKEEEGMKEDLLPSPQPSSSPSSSSPLPPPLPRSAHGETLAEASGVPSVVRYALWSLEKAERVEQEEEEDGGAKEKSSSSTSSSSTPPPPRSSLLAALPPEKRQLFRLLAVAHAALLETGRCWPEGEEEEEEAEETGEKKKETKEAFARALSLPRRFLSSLSASSSSSSSSSSFPPLFYSTLRGAAGQTEPPPRASLRVTSLGGAFALVSAGIEGAFAAAAASSSKKKNLASSSFPAAFSLTVKLADHFDGQGAPRTDGEKGERKKKLWQLLCDEIASPLAASAAASRSLSPHEASLPGLPDDLLREVLLRLLPVGREGEPPQQQQQQQRRFELYGERERGSSRSRNALLLRLLMRPQSSRAQEARRRREERWEEKLLLFYSQEEFP